MAVDIVTLSEIKKKARLYNTTRDQIKARIEENVKVAIEKLKEAEKELLDEVEIEFGENVFATLLESIEYGKEFTDEEIKAVLCSEVPDEFGPSEESFCSLCKEIGSFKEWRVMKEEEEGINYYELIPKNLKLESGTLSWDKVDCDCFYEIEMKTMKWGSSSTTTTKRSYRSTEPKYTFYKNRYEDETCYVRVRTFLTHSNIKSAWSESVKL